MNVNNQIQIHGRLVRDPETKQISNGPVTNFTVAVQRKYMNKDGVKLADFFDCVAFGHTGEFVSKYFQKGKEIAVSGEMRCDKYTDKNGNMQNSWKIRCDDVSFCGKNEESSANNSFNNQNNNYSGKKYSSYEEDDGDIPF